MKLYDGGRAPNPRRVRIFLAEKGISVPLEPVDLGAMAQRSEAVTALNPLQRLPILQLDDGTVLTETIAICRYFEELHPEPALFGRTALDRALVEMWQRRVEFQWFMAVGHAFRHIHPAMKEWENPRFPEWGEANKPKALEFLGILDRELATREFIAGEHYSVADITGLVAFDFMKPARIELPVSYANIRRWYEAVASRPSAGA